MTTTRTERQPLRAGDLIFVDFDPIRGTEQAGTRPAIVISASELHETSRRAIVCPISRNVSPWPTKVYLPAGLPVAGAVLTDQVRAIDRQERIIRVIGAAPSDVLRAVRRRVAALLEFELNEPAE
jgi:mRNA interferase MazF